MRLRYLFIILALLVIVPTLLLLFFSAGEGGALMYIANVLAVVAVLFLIFFYRRVLKPLDTIADGMDLLAAQDFSSSLSPVGQAEADRIVLLFNRLMARIKEERLTLLEQNGFLSLLIEESPMGVILLDFDNRITLMNTSAKRFLEVDDCTGCELQQLPSLLMGDIMQLGDGESRTIRVNGAAIYSCSRLSFMSKGFRRPFIIIESMTDEIFKAEKSAYEKVIRMIAHEVNNSVAGMTSALSTVGDVLSEMTPDTLENDVADILDVIKVCEERGYNMSRFITDFANVVKIPVPVLNRVNINECVVPCIAFVKQMCRERNIELHTELVSGNVPVDADVLLFEQVMLNIVKNSVESIGFDGRIVIETLPSPARIVVTDNGAGITAEDKEHIFSPFFSTKTNGQGLGLMFVREILSRHHCAFSLATASDGLTRFTISFPEV